MLIDDLDLSLIELISLCKKHDVLENSFRTEYLGLLIRHIVVGKRVKCRGEHIITNISDPLA
jgi:hypothetical protein